MLIILVMWNQIVISFGNRFKSIQKFAKSCYHQAVLEEMLSKNDDTDFNKVDQAGWYPINRAIALANIEIIKKLLQKGANPNLNVKDYHSPLCKAILEGKEGIVTFLIENGADVNMVDGQDCTPVTLAIFRENIEILKTLLQKGATDT